MHFSGLLLAVENNRESQRRQWLFSDRAFEIVFAHSKHTYVWRMQSIIPYFPLVFFSLLLIFNIMLQG
jgi:hypothetical protein